MSIRSGIFREVFNVTVPTVAFLTAIYVPATASLIQTAGYHQPNGLGAATYRRLSLSDPTEAGEQTSNGGTVRWGLIHRVANGRKQVDVLAYGIQSEDEDITTIARSIYEGGSAGDRLTHADVFWPEGIWNATDYIGVFGEGVITWATLGTYYRQHTWTKPFFVTANPDDTLVRPDGVEFHGGRFEAYVNGDPAYFFHAQFGAESNGVTEYNVEADPDITTADHVFVTRRSGGAPTLLQNGVDYTLSGIGTSTLSIGLNVAHGATDIADVKVTNKWDCGDYQEENDLTSIYGQSKYNKANESSPIWHGGGDRFVVEDIHVEGFVAILRIDGDWVSDAADRQSKDCRIKNVTFNNCDFLLTKEVKDFLVSRVTGGVISETQTDGGVRSIYNPTGTLTPNFKPPHVYYGTDSSSDSHSINVTLEYLQGINKFSSNYKQRNCRGLTIVANTVEDFVRVVDLEGVDNFVAHFDVIRIANKKHYDTLRNIFNFFGVKDAVVNVGYAEIEDDVTGAAVFRSGDVINGGGARRLCENITVNFDTLKVSGTSARTSDWIPNRAGIDCYVNIKHLIKDGADTGHVMRFRGSDDDLGVFTGCVRGGISIDRITLLSANTLKIARCSNDDSTTSTGVVIKFDKSKIVGSATIDSSTVSAGTGNNPIIDVADRGYKEINTDAAATLTAIIDSPNVRHTGTLTADRAITLSTTNARAGDKRFIVRTGGDTGGPWNLNVGTGPLKPLVSGTRGEFTFDGTAWYLSDYAVL